MTKDTVKSRITQAVLDQVPNAQRPDFTTASKTWWMNFRADGGLRLNEVGEIYFKLAEIEYFELPLNYKKNAGKYATWHGFLMELNRKLTCPYYIGKTSPSSIYVKIYDSKIAMMISLYGDIYDYVTSTKSRK